VRHDPRRRRRRRSRSRRKAIERGGK